MQEGFRTSTTINGA